jgi:hypothetical protein
MWIAEAVGLRMGRRFELEKEVRYQRAACHVAVMVVAAGGHW